MPVRTIPLLLALLLLVVQLPATHLNAASRSLRIGILRDQERITIHSDQPVELTDASLRQMVLQAGSFEFYPSSAAIEITGIGQFGSPVRLIPASGARIRVGTRPYRGMIEIRLGSAGRLTIINELELEEYLYGVLKMEVDPRWPAEALKAQAVASRTLALYSLGRYSREGYDVRATTETQVYAGVAAEDARTTAAVDATRGEIMTFDGRPVFAAYHSDSGGHTESSELVWGGRYLYLKGVPDPYAASAPSHLWRSRLDLTAFEERVRRTGRAVRGIASVEIAEVSPSGRAQTVHIRSASGVLVLKGTELRSLLGADLLKSTMFTVRHAPDDEVVEFSGRGAGHGVGLSQWGARGQALLGKSYQEILRYYYTGISFEIR